MAIHPTEEAPQQPATAQAIDIEAWTEQATAAINTLTVSTPGDVHGATVSLQIPLDDRPEPRPTPAATAAKEGGSAGYYTRKEPLRRDSMKRREALLKGKEGSRRRQRWENGMR